MKSIDRLKQKVFKRPDTPPPVQRLKQIKQDAFDEMVEMAKAKGALISYNVIHLKDLL